MLDSEQVPRLVAAVSGGGGGLLLAAPQVFTGPAGLTGADRGVRVVGLADLLLVPGLVGTGAKWPWMTGRAALSLMQAAFFESLAERAERPQLARAASALLLSLAVMDGLTALVLRHRAR